MTRDEFINDVTEIYEIERFCSENEIYDVLDRLRTGDDYTEYLDSWFRDMIYDEGWRETRDAMNNIDNDGYEYYVLDEYDCEWYPLDHDDIEGFKDEILEIMDDRGDWDEQEEPEEDDEEEPVPCEPEADTDSIDAASLMDANSGFLSMVSEEAAKKQEAEDNDEDDNEDGGDDDRVEEWSEAAANFFVPVV